METAGAPPKPAHRRLTLVGKTCTGILKAVGLAKSKTQVLQKVQLLCYAAWLMLFGSTLTFVGLSLIMWLETMHPAVVAILFLGIGIFMFLIPIVPGLAVYLTGGILIVQIYWKNVFGENEFGFYMAIIFATGLCYDENYGSCTFLFITALPSPTSPVTIPLVHPCRPVTLVPCHDM